MSSPISALEVTCQIIWTTEIETVLHCPKGQYRAADPGGRMHRTVSERQRGALFLIPQIKTSARAHTLVRKHERKQP
jgi:hypothetical protein